MPSRSPARVVPRAIGDEALPAPLDGILRGLVHDGVPVDVGAKVVEVDPRGDLEKVYGIGPRPARIAAGVLAAMRGVGGGAGPSDLRL